MFKIFSIVVLAVLITAVITAVLVSRNNQTTTQIPSGTPGETPFAVSMSVESGSIGQTTSGSGGSPSSVQTTQGQNAAVGAQYIATVEFTGQQAAKPNAFQIKLGFDGTRIKASNLQNGNLWTSSNVLESSIDNPGGFLKYAAGQGFGASVAPGNNLFSFTVTVVKAGVIPAFSIYPESKFGYINNEQLMSLSPSSVLVKLVEVQ